INNQEPDDTLETMGGTYIQPIRGDWIRRLLSLARIVVPILLIVWGVISIINSWSFIEEVLSCCMVGAIIGGGALTYLSLRFGHYFNSNVMFTGAIVGAILACVFQYNVLDIGTELAMFIEVVGSTILMPLIGIWILISCFRR
ncbi:MAG: hypothetical protein IKJ01_10340, partial [Lachnospiraceae bacterium]|nr:hypothetical protein [Lachnospiraceae bacterium]